MHRASRQLWREVQVTGTLSIWSLRPLLWDSALCISEPTRASLEGPSDGAENMGMWGFQLLHGSFSWHWQVYKGLWPPRSRCDEPSHGGPGQQAEAEATARV